MLDMSQMLVPTVSMSSTSVRKKNQTPTPPQMKELPWSNPLYEEEEFEHTLSCELVTFEDPAFLIDRVIADHRATHGRRLY